MLIFVDNLLKSSKEIECCPPGYDCYETETLGTYVSEEYWLENFSMQPIAAPSLFTSTRNKKTLNQPREPFTDTFVSEYDPREGWNGVMYQKKELQKKV